MTFLKNIFNKKEAAITTYDDFWNWFKREQKLFYKVVKGKGDVERYFFAKLSTKLNELKAGFNYLTGMLDENTVELVITADGAIKNIAFVEELVSAAPLLDRWKFTALKPPTDIKNVSIEMAGHEFNGDNISFYSNDDPKFPDEIDITIVHNDLNDDNKRAIINGSFIFMDNFIGELNFATTIDEIQFESKKNAVKELIPIERLKPFLIWREKEFIEKYDEVRYSTANDQYSILQAEMANGNGVLAVVNIALLDWEGKASHPWVVIAELRYDGSKNNGMPNNETLKLLETIEEELLAELKDFDGYLNIGRQTADGIREIFFSCREFRLPSKVLYKLSQKYSGTMEIEYNIYKDKYWKSFNRFLNSSSADKYPALPNRLVLYPPTVPVR